jgi:hypothetical protein
MLEQTSDNFLVVAAQRVEAACHARNGDSEAADAHIVAHALALLDGQPTYFSRSFRRILGQTPHPWRQMRRWPLEEPLAEPTCDRADQENLGAHPGAGCPSAGERRAGARSVRPAYRRVPAVHAAAVLRNPVQIAHSPRATVTDTQEEFAGRDARDRAATVPRASMTALALMVIGLMTGCSGSPSRSILGSYFPSWMVCALIGLVAALLARVALKATGLLGELPAPLVVLLSIGCATTFALWLLWLA